MNYNYIIFIFIIIIGIIISYCSISYLKFIKNYYNNYNNYDNEETNICDFINIQDILINTSTITTINKAINSSLKKEDKSYKLIISFIDDKEPMIFSFKEKYQLDDVFNQIQEDLNLE